MSLAVLMCWGVVSAADLPALEEILARVAANQECAVAARTTIVYTQLTHTRLMRSSTKLAREERRRYTVTPTADATTRKLESCEGRYLKGREYLPYSDPKFRYKGMDIDGDLVDSITNDVVVDKDSRDGISPHLFPLTAKQQQHYVYKLAGTQTVNGVEAIRLTFEPKKGDEDGDWAGEVLIDPNDYQPMRVATHLATQIPWGVKVFLGTNVRQLGFTVSYRKVANGVWFPVSYGAEFHLRVLFGYARTIALSMENKDFRRAQAESKIEFLPDAQEPPKP